MLSKIICIAALMAPWPAAAGEIMLAIGGVEVIQSPVPVGTVVVGEPKVADVAVDGTSAILVFGRGSGETDLVVLDRERKTIMTTRVTVGGAARGGTVTVRRASDKGITDEIWNCSATVSCVKGVGN